MVDEAFRVYLIEVNTNPCLATPCPLLSHIISSVLDTTFRIAVDPLFQSEENPNAKKSKQVRTSRKNIELCHS